MDTIKLGVVIPTMGTSHLIDTLASLPPGCALYLRDNRVENWGVAKSWNWGIRQAVADGCTHILVSNDDVEFDPLIIPVLITAFDHDSRILMTTAYNTRDGEQCGEDQYDHPDFSLFMIPQRFLDVMGPFDEQFWPAYFEDNDMSQRMKEGNWRTLTPHSAPMYHWGSRTIRELAPMKAMNDHFFEKNKAYFRQKWGFVPGK